MSNILANDLVEGAVSSGGNATDETMFDHSAAASDECREGGLSADGTTDETIAEMHICLFVSSKIDSKSISTRSRSFPSRFAKNCWARFGLAFILQFAFLFSVSSSGDSLRALAKISCLNASRNRVR